MRRHLKTIVVAGVLLSLIIPSRSHAQREAEIAPPSGRFDQPETPPPGEIERIPAGPPDLSITRLRAVPDRPQPGARVQLEAHVRNDGEAGLDGIAVRFFIGRRSVGEGGIRYLRGGASGTAKVTIEAAAEGRTGFRAVVDPENAIPESNERNNERQGEFTVQPAARREGTGRGAPPEEELPAGGRIRERRFGSRPGAPPPDADLMVRSISVKKERVVVGEAVPLEAVIVNGGPGKADRVQVRIMAEEERVGRDQQKSLTPRAQATVRGTWRPKRTGHHAVFVIVDPDEKVPDPDRRNNVREQIVEVFPVMEAAGEPGRPAFGAAVKKIGAAPGMDIKAPAENLKKVVQIPPPPGWETAADTGPSIVVTSPAVGSVWPQGSSQVITWTILSGKAGPTFTISYWRSGKNYPIVTKKTFTAHAHPWKVPKSLPDGSYTIVVRDGKDSTISGKSASFAIGKPKPKIVEAAMIDVWSPPGGKTYSSGDALPVRWYSIGLDPKKDKVKVILYPDGKSHHIKNAMPPPLFVIGGGEPSYNPTTVISGSAIDGAMDNTGTLDWKVPSSYHSGDFRVRVENKSGSASDDSGVFTLKTKGPSLPHRAPSWLGGTVTITSPVAGDTWKPGTHKATWKCSTYAACKDKSFRVTLLSRTGDVKVSSATAIATTGEAVLAVFDTTPPGQYIVRIETMDQKAQIDSGVFNIDNPKLPTNPVFTIADAKWKFSSSSTGKLGQVQLLVHYKSDTDFFIGNYGDNTLGAQSVQLKITTAEKLGMIVPGGAPIKKPYQFWLDKKVLLNETHSVTGGGGTMAMTYPKQVLKKGSGQYVLTLQTKSPYVIRSLFWIFKKCSPGFDSGPFSPGCLCHGTHAPKLSAVLTVHAKHTTDKDSKTFYMNDAPTKVQEIDHNITDIDCAKPKW